MFTTTKPRTIKDVRGLWFEKPEGAGPAWTPVTHNDLLGRLASACRARGWSPGKPVIHLGPKWSSSGDSHAEMVATFDLDVPGYPKERGLSYALGVRNSNRQASRATMLLYGGVRQDDPDVGVPLSQWSLGEHVPGAPLDKDLSGALDGFAKESRTWVGLVRKMRRAECSEEQAVRTLVKAARIAAGTHHTADRLLTWERLGVADAAFLKGRRPFVWDLLVAFALATRTAPPLFQMANVLRFYNLLSEEFTW